MRNGPIPFVLLFVATLAAAAYIGIKGAEATNRNDRWAECVIFHGYEVCGARPPCDWTGCR